MFYLELNALIVFLELKIHILCFGEKQLTEINRKVR